METEGIARKFGGSIGIIIPKEIVEQEKIKPNSKIKIDILKVDDISDTFGKLKRKISGQELKNRAREDW